MRLCASDRIQQTYKNRYCVLAFFLVLGSHLTAEAFSVSLADVEDVFEIAHEVSRHIVKAWDLVEPHYMENKITPPMLKSKQKKIIERVNLITESIYRVEHRLLAGTLSAINGLHQDLPKMVRLELRLDSLLEKTSIIEAADHSFNEYLKSDYNRTGNGSMENYESYTLQNFAENAVSHRPGSVRSIMEQLHYLVAPETWHQQLLANEGGFLNQIKLALQVTFCKTDCFNKVNNKTVCTFFHSIDI